MGKGKAVLGDAGTFSHDLLPLHPPYPHPPVPRNGSVSQTMRLAGAMGRAIKKGRGSSHVPQKKEHTSQHFPQQLHLVALLGILVG